jgi:hypothetical protein
MRNTAGVRRYKVQCNLSKEMLMPKFVIEREIPGAGKMSPTELKTISKKSCGVLSSLGPSVHWINSYVTADKIYCVYHAVDESLIRRHAELGGFPANKISMVTTLIDPATAE